MKKKNICNRTFCSMTALYGLSRVLDLKSTDSKEIANKLYREVQRCSANQNGICTVNGKTCKYYDSLDQKYVEKLRDVLSMNTDMKFETICGEISATHLIEDERVRPEIVTEIMNQCIDTNTVDQGHCKAKDCICPYYMGSRKFRKEVDEALKTFEMMKSQSKKFANWGFDSDGNIVTLGYDFPDKK